jgi:ubiquinone/menaquinone biosynthesis C-methylase UbiE
MTREMETYYARRADEYDHVYALAHWQADLAILHARIPALFEGRRVFETACGTGYWTERIALRAASVHATDLNEETLAIARTRVFGPAAVTLERGDAYAPPAQRAAFDAGLAALWLSHVDLARMDEFLDAFHAALAPDAVVLMFDERDTPARRTVSSRHDAAGNRYEPRRLASGERFEIIKNFFDGARLGDLLRRHARDLTYEELERFWVVSYRTR